MKLNKLRVDRYNKEANQAGSKIEQCAIADGSYPSLDNIPKIAYIKSVYSFFKTTLRIRIQCV